MNASELVRTARRGAGLTQQALAQRLGVSQAAVARLESGRANPTVATLDRVMRTTGHRLELQAVPARPEVDSTLLREALTMTPAERLRAADRLFRDAEVFAAAAARTRSR